MPNLARYLSEASDAKDVIFQRSEWSPSFFLASDWLKLVT